MPLVSVIIASYNQAEFLPHAVESVLHQTFEDWELILVDNGSTDGSQELLRKYAGNPKVRLLLHPENLAPTKRLNHAISLATGEFISLLYSDDHYLPEKLAIQVKLFSEQPSSCGVVYSPGHRLNVDTNQQFLDLTLKTSGWILADLLNGLGRAFINPISPLIRRACFLKYPFYEDLFIEGESIFFRFAMSWQFHFDPRPTVVMRDHARNLGRSLKRNIPNILTCLERLPNFAELSAENRQVLDRVMTRFFRNSGWMVLRVTNDSSWARNMFLRGLRRDWRQVLHPKTVIGLGMTMLPPATLANLNAALFRLKPVPYHVDHVAE